MGYLVKVDMLIARVKYYSNSGSDDLVHSAMELYLIYTLFESTQVRFLPTPFRQ